jgi:hypothetical protein
MVSLFVDWLASFARFLDEVLCLAQGAKLWLMQLKEQLEN